MKFVSDGIIVHALILPMKNLSSYQSHRVCGCVSSGDVQKLLMYLAIQTDNCLVEVLHFVQQSVIEVYCIFSRSCNIIMCLYSMIIILFGTLEHLIAKNQKL